MSALVTTISLPRGFVSPDQVQRFLELVFGEFNWFGPARFGAAMPDQTLEKGRDLPTQMLARFYAENQRLSLDDKSHKSWISIIPDRRGEKSYYGVVTRETPAKKVENAQWQEAFVAQVLSVMLLFDSPLALSALQEDRERKLFRWVPNAENPKITTRDLTIRGYDQGLPGLFWRNFYGPPFVEMFGDRLRALPKKNARELQEGYWLVQPYELPSDAETKSGREKERELIRILGPEHFFDFDQVVLPKVRPKLPGR